VTAFIVPFCRVAVMVPELRMPGATSVAKPPLDAEIGMLKLSPRHDVGVLDVVDDGEEARGLRSPFASASSAFLARRRRLFPFLVA
jgi:hypothetical protein